MLFSNLIKGFNNIMYPVSYKIEDDSYTTNSATTSSSPEGSRFSSLSKPVSDFIYAERWLNGGSRTYSKVSSYTEMQLKYQPQSQIQSFSVPVVEVPNDRLTISLANPDQELLAKYVGVVASSFFVHPQFYKDSRVSHMDEIASHSQIDDVEVAPTASSRTVLVFDSLLPTHCIKMHCPAQISRFNRKLDGRDILKSINTSLELDKAMEHPNFPKIFGFLPESIGVSIECENREDSWGYLVREMQPHPVVENSNERTLFPLFSMYSSDLNKESESTSPLMVSLIQKSGLEPMDFILNKVMFPIIESWCFLARDLGLLTQAHGQNLLLEVGSDSVPTRVIFRDLSTYMDREARLKKGLSNEGFPSREADPEDCVALTEEAQKGYYSLTYDSFVGHHLFDFLAKTVKEYYGIEKEILQTACRAKFRESFPEADRYFPRTVLYYSEHCTDGFRQDLTDTGKVPDWR